MGLSENLSILNFERNMNWQVPKKPSDEVRQAIFAFKGDVYVGLDSETLSKSDIKYAQKNLAILSGLYGLLKPLDLMYPYRLEMGTKMGMAWQVSRDVAELWGKGGDGMSASNVLNKKKSFPIIQALERSDVATKRKLGAIYMHRVLQPEDVSKLIEILDQVDARRFAVEKAQELLDQAIEAVEGIGLSNEGVESLRRLGQWALEGND